MLGKDLDNTVVTFDLALNDFRPEDKGPDQWVVRWDGLVFEYELLRKRAALLYAINATSILCGSIAFGVSNGFEKDELGMQFKFMGGIIMFPVDFSIFPSYSYQKHGFGINAAGSIGIGILFPFLGYL